MEVMEVVQPHRKDAVLGRLGNATAADARAAITAAKAAAPAWRRLPFEERAAIVLKAADLLAGPWRQTLNAATMLGQSKTAYQAEIDSACELIDFWRYNVAYAAQILREQPRSQAGVWNRMDYRPLEGFVLAITPFNFTAIAGNLPTAPALMGNTVIWKPAPTQQFAAHFTMRLLEEAGLPPGVINLVTGDGRAVSQAALTDRTWRASISPGRRPPSAPCGARSARTWPATAAIRGWSARPAARTSSSPTRPPTRAC
jgi:1-pyrroline-5-carboxylate dehydrogenase